MTHSVKKATTPAPRFTLSTAACSTLVTMLATDLAVTPLTAIFTDKRWIVSAWCAVALLVLPAAVIRQRYRQHVAQLAPGLVLVIFYLTANYLADNSIARVIPAAGSVTALRQFTDELSSYVHVAVSPAPSIPAARLGLILTVLLVAAFSDTVAVYLSAGLILAPVYLLILTLSADIPRHAVTPWLFVCSAVALLLIFADHAVRERRAWGKVLRAGSDPSYGKRAVTGTQIAVIAVVATVLMSVWVPTNTHNPLAEAVHHGNGNGGSNGGDGPLDPFASLRGELTRQSPTSLLTVHVSSGNPYYLRQLVLDDFTGKRWQSSTPQTGSTLPLDPHYLPVLPVDVTYTGARNYQATITVTGLQGSPPTLQQPSEIEGLSSKSKWNIYTGAVSAVAVSAGQRYTETVIAPQPQAAQLAQVPDFDYSTSESPDLAQVLQSDLQLPSLPAAIQSRTDQVVANAVGPYAKAKALSDYFTDPANGFIYSLSTKLGDSGNDLLDFLNNKQGYCQQYAAAMAVMLRQADVPSRVVLGYTHVAADSNGDFTVVTTDAHAWVEAYFTGVGWLAFDPTPLSGVDSARAQSLAYAPPVRHESTSPSTPQTRTKAPVTPPPATAAHPTAHPSKTNATTTSSHGSTPWYTLVPTAGIILILLVISLPKLRRLRRRRRRLRAARHGSYGLLWDELSATATDLGFTWSLARSPRQTTQWVHEQTADRRAAAGIAVLASTIERERYSAPDSLTENGTAAQKQASAEYEQALRDVEAGLRSAVGWRQRLRAWLWPSRGPSRKLIGGPVERYSRRRQGTRR